MIRLKKNEIKLKSMSETKSRPNYPTQKRSIERYDFIIKMIEEEWKSGMQKEMSIYDIATLTDIPAQSIYRIFPSIDAVYFAIAERYLNSEISYFEKLDIQAYKCWQEAFIQTTLAAKERYENHPYAMELLLGLGMTSEIRSMDLQNNNYLAKVLSDKITKLSKTSLDLTNQMHVVLTLVDAIWSLSYRCDKTISDFYLQESIKSAISYLEIYLMRF